MLFKAKTLKVHSTSLDQNDYRKNICFVMKHTRCYLQLVFQI